MNENTYLSCSPHLAFFILLVLGLFNLSCDNSNLVEPTATEPCVSWCGTVAPWPHDGNPFESENFIVYSDAASLKARMDLAEIAEEVLSELKTLFEIESNEVFILPPNQTKFHLYTFKSYNPLQWGGQGFWGGFLVYSMDHPGRTELGLTERGFYSRLVKHELTHMIQGAIVGSTATYSVETWFEEGLAELVSALNPEKSITTVARLNALIEEYGELNPIAIKNDILPDIEGVGLNYYYPMYELTARYLLDEKGLGQSYLEIKGVFMDMREGIAFDVAFQSRFGISVSEFEAEFFARMKSYLS